MCPRVCSISGHVQINLRLAVLCVPKYTIYSKTLNVNWMDLKSKVGERITQLRKAKKLSQQKFAYIADMERTYLTHIEKGRKNISVTTLQKITTALDISVKDFFDAKEFNN